MSRKLWKLFELNVKAVALLNNGIYTDVAQAIEYLNNAVSLDPDYTETYNNLGTAYQRKVSRWSRTTKQLRCLAGTQ